MRRKIVVKVGSNVLTKDNGQLDTTVITRLVEQISTLKNAGFDVVLVSSGAVAAGKSVYEMKNVKSSIKQKQIFSAIGQVKLLNLYYELFSMHGLICAQVLATKEDFMGGEHYKNMKRCINGLLRKRIIPIVNENDVVSLDEITFTDNDELAGLTAFLIEAEHLIILSNVDGLYDGNPADEDSEVIPNIRQEDDFTDKIQSSKSTAGRGGMISKYNIGKRASDKGIKMTIAHGKDPKSILKIVEEETIGTTFLPEGE